MTQIRLNSARVEPTWLMWLDLKGGWETNFVNKKTPQNKVLPKTEYGYFVSTSKTILYKLKEPLIENFFLPDITKENSGSIMAPPNPSSSPYMVHPVNYIKT